MTDAFQNPAVFYSASGVWAVVTIAIFISAVRICYAIEARSGRPLFKHGVPGFANVIPVALNVGVAKDVETQALRRRMTARLLIVLVSLVGFAAFVGMVRT